MESPQSWISIFISDKKDFKTLTVIKELHNHKRINSIRGYNILKYFCTHM